MTEEAADPYFVTLVLSLSSSAMAYLGKVPNPATGKIERDLEQARFSIELLSMLENKTQGRLTDKEHRLLSNVLADLKLNFADEALKGQQTAAKADTSQGNEAVSKPRTGPEIILPPGTGSGKGPEIIKP
ncbi:MAG: DUF1844 domain-containing protein [Elusimicrobia bacterium]|nr:DUF1844 domain-containing protein [Elusimicrobiota bacterium]